MITFIVGGPGKSLVAEGMAHVLKKQGKTPVVFHEGATQSKIEAAMKKHSDVLVCWIGDVSKNVNDPDMLVEITKGGKSS